MTARQFISRQRLTRTTLQLLRELIICVAIPSILMIGATMLAHGQESASSQQQSDSQSDTKVAQEINRQLAASATLRSVGLGVSVQGGTATLSGVVPNTDVQQQADALVAAVPGVTGVDDQMSVGAGTATATDSGAGRGAGQGNVQSSGQASGPSGGDTQNNPPVPPGAAAQPAVPNSTQGTDPADGNMAPVDNGVEGEVQNNGSQNNPNQNYPEQPQENSPNGDHPDGVMPPPPAGVPSIARYGEHAPPPLLTIPAGTPVVVSMLQTVDSRNTKPGTLFRGMVLQDVTLQYGIIAIPRGAYVEGTVIDSRPPGQLKGHPKLALQLSHLDMSGSNYILSTYIWARRGPGKGGQTAATVTGTAAFGAIVGGAVGGGGTALLGGLLGGLGGAGISALSSGPQLLVPAESVLTFALNTPLTVREPTASEVRALGENVPAYGYGRGGSYDPRYPPPGPTVPGGPPGGYPY